MLNDVEYPKQGSSASAETRGHAVLCEQLSFTQGQNGDRTGDDEHGRWSDKRRRHGFGGGGGGYIGPVTADHER
jgi:hypothetical protein